ncbi:MAG: hypothetical protein HEP71_02980 [Roseivirga sp.]|nr:hypothetical protein [Roseivirga sp.]
MLGLGVAMGAFLLILFYVRYETSFDDFHQDNDRIYRLIMTRYTDGEYTSKRPDTYPAMARVIKESYAEVEAISKVIYNSRGGTLTEFEVGGKSILRDDLKTLFAASDFFDIFSLPLVEGDIGTLDQPFMAMVSDQFATAMYGTENPVGQTFKEDDGRDYLITGIFKKWKRNSHLDFDLIKSFETIGARHNRTDHQDSWHWSRMKTYVKLNAEVDPDLFESQVAQVVNDNKPRSGDVVLDETISLQLLNDIRLGSDFESSTFDSARSGVYGFLLIGFVILAMGWLNFINLSIARGLDRTKEAGIKKVLGAGRVHLIKQQFIEAFQVNLFAFIIGMSLYQLLLPQLRTYADIPSHFNPGITLMYWTVGGLLIGSFLSGAYPAMALSKVNVILAMKNKLSGGRGSLKNTRTALTAIQFTISLSLLIAVTVIYKQLNLLRSVDLGTRIEGVLVVKGPRNFDYDAFSANPDVLKNEWKRIPGVEQIASSYAVPGGSIYPYQIKRADQPDAPWVYIPEHQIDHGFVSLYGLELIAGRSFDKNIMTDDSAAVINESALKALGFESAQQALGKPITSPENEFIRHVVGVIKDFHQLSPATARQPLILALDTESRGYYSIHYNTADLSQLQASVASTFDKVFPGNIYHSFFLDDYFAEQYKADERLGTLLSVFSVVAISLAAMGLISMTYFSAVRRMKEMSIRKVLGAGFTNLVRLLSSNGNLSFLLGSLLAIPAIYFLLDRWLAGYHSRISLQLFDFALPMLALYTLALVAMVLVMLRIVHVNPVKSLREE